MLTHEEIRDRGPQSFVKYLETVSSHLPELDINKLIYLCDTASSEAVRNAEMGDRELSLLWARAAISCYKMSGLRDLRRNNSRDHSTIYFRMRMIRLLGRDQSEDVLDPSRIADWFLDTYSAQFHRASLAARRWAWLATVPNHFGVVKDDIIYLHWIRCGLKVIRDARRLGCLDVQADLQRWFALEEEIDAAHKAYLDSRKPDRPTPPESDPQAN